MTMEEYYEYSNIAFRIFNFMNGKINRLNSQCTFQIDMYDRINGIYANIRYPNNVTLYIGNIIDSWDDKYSTIMNKRDYIGTMICWAMAHELHHADQLISMLQYNANPTYKLSVEGDVERASYNWVSNNRRDLSQIGGFAIIIEQLDSNNLPDAEDCNYRKASIKEFYKQTIANIIIRDFDLFNKLKIFTDDTLVDDIILNFEDIDRIVIKSNGSYLKENINIFCDLAYRWAGYYDRYLIDVRADFATSEGRYIAFVTFKFSNRLVKPMIFKDNSIYGGI